MLAFKFEGTGREGLFTTKRTSVESKLGCFFHDNDQLSSREWIMTESQETMVTQEYRGNRGVLLQLCHNIADRLS